MTLPNIIFSPFQKTKKYEVVLQAKDHGNPPLSSTAVVTLNVVDSNTHSPVFKVKEVHTYLNYHPE